MGLVDGPWSGTYTSPRCAGDREHEEPDRPGVAGAPSPSHRTARGRPVALQGDLSEAPRPGEAAGAASVRDRGVRTTPPPPPGGDGSAAEGAVDQGHLLLPEPVLLRVSRGGRRAGARAACALAGPPHPNLERRLRHGRGALV